MWLSALGRSTYIIVENIGKVREKDEKRRGIRAKKNVMMGRI